MDEILKALYGTDNAEEIFKKKETEQQTRSFSPRKPKRVELSVAECKKLCIAVGLDYLAGYEGRVVEHVITDETTDRYGDIVRAKGAVIENYKKNPVILFGHDYKDFPIGKSIKIWHDKDEQNIKSWGLYLDNRVDTTGRSDLAFKFITNGSLPAVSIGFMPMKTHRPKSKEERDKLGLGEFGVEFLQWELLEYSAVPVPANPNALQNMIKAGELTRSDCKVIIQNKLVEETGFDDFIDNMLEVFTTNGENYIPEIEPNLLEAMDKVTKMLNKFNDTLVKLSEILKPLTDLQVSSPDNGGDTGNTEDKGLYILEGDLNIS